MASTSGGPVSCLQSMPMFIFIMAVYTLFYTCSEMYLMAIVTSIEKKFGFSSYQSGMIFSIKEVAYFLTLTLVTYFGGSGHRPRIIGIMGYLGVLAGYTSLLPHFMFSGNTEYDTAKSNSWNDQPSLCAEKLGNIVNISSTSPDSDKDCSAMSGSFNAGAYSLFLLGSVLQGFSGSCHALSTTYIDDCETPSRSAFYLGIISAMRPLGPVFGFILGGFFSTFHETLQDPGYGADDPRWVGAWWLGYVVCPTIFLVPATLILFFPKSLSRNSAEQLTASADITQNGCAGSGDVKIKTVKNETTVTKSRNSKGIKGLFSAILRLLSNQAYMMFLVANVLGDYMISGMFTFLPKYLETQFNMTAASANLLLGCVATLLAAVGIFIGGLLQAKCNWLPHSSALYIFVMNAIFTAILVLLMMTGCPQIQIHGFNIDSQLLSQPIDNGYLLHNDQLSHHSYIDDNSYLASTSYSDKLLHYNRDCQCDDDFYPVCGNNNETYRSPCHAGCSRVYNQSYMLCSVIGENGSSTAGQCSQECQNTVLYIVLLSIGAFMFCSAGVPGYNVVLRSVKEEDKSLSLGFMSSSVSVFTYIPGPMLYGLLVDSTCLLWRHSSCGEGSCLHYDTDKFRLLLHGLTTVLFGMCTIFCGFTALILWKQHKHKTEQLNQEHPVEYVNKISSV